MASTLPITLYTTQSFAPVFFATDPETALPIDLTNVTEITVGVPAAAGGCVYVRLTTSTVVILGDVKLGNFQALFPVASVSLFAQSALESDDVTVDPSTLQSITVAITDSVNPNRKPFVIVQSGALAVLAPPC